MDTPFLDSYYTANRSALDCMPLNGRANWTERLAALAIFGVLYNISRLFGSLP